MTSDAPHLNDDYAAFGKVISGIDEADVIVNQKRNGMDKPLEDQIIEKAWEVK